MCGGKAFCSATQCTDDGMFEPMQRENLPGNKDECFCVDWTGVEVNGTRASCDTDVECDGLHFYPRSAEMLKKMMGHASLKQVVLGGALHLLAAIFIWTPVLGGFYLAVFNAIRTNSPVCFRDFFRCFCCRYYCKLLRLSFVLRFLEGLLLLALILPGIWFRLASVFAIPVHKEYPFLGVCGSIRISIQVINRHFCSFFGFLLLLALVQIVGFLCLIVGLLYTTPLVFVALCYCYHDLIGIVPQVPVAVPMDTPVTVHM